MARNEGKHRNGKTTGRKIARVALTGAVVAAPFAVALPADAASPSTWDKVAQCEGSGNWQTETGNGFSGGLQFTPSTWKAYGGSQYASNANDASREQQIAVAERVLQAQGPGAWPNCSQKAGLSKSGSAENQDVSSGSGSSSKADSSSSKHKSSSHESSKQKSSSHDSAPKQSKSSSQKGEYTIESGDTLGKIGSKLGMGWKDLFDKNKDVVQDPNVITPGQHLKTS